MAEKRNRGFVTTDKKGVLRFHWDSDPKTSRVYSKCRGVVLNIKKEHIEKVIEYFVRAKVGHKNNVPVYVNFWFDGHRKALEELIKKKIIIRHDMKLGRQHIASIYEYRQGLYEFTYGGGDDEVLRYIGKK